MSANHKRLLALVLWAEVVLALAYLKWWSRPLDHADLHPDERAFILRLPEGEILTRMIDQSDMVSLAMPEPPKPPPAEAAVKKPAAATLANAAAQGKKEKSADTAPPVVPAAPSISVVEHARVLSKVCKVEIQSSTRVAVCYAVIAVPKDRMAALSNAADKVSVWIEGK